MDIFWNHNIHPSRIPELHISASYNLHFTNADVFSYLLLHRYLQSFEVHEAGGSTGGSGKDSDEEKSDTSTTKNGRTRHERNSKASTRQGTIEKIEKNSTDKRAKAGSAEKVEEKPSTPNKPALNKSRRSSTPNKPVAKQAVPVSTSNKPSTKPPVPNKLPLSNISSTTPNKQPTTPTGKTTAKSSLSKQGGTNKPSTPETIKETPEVEEKKEIKVENENGEVAKSEVKTEEPGNGQKNLRHQDSIESDIDVDEEVTSPESELAVDVVNSPGCMSDTSESKSDTRSDAGTDEVMECAVGDKIQVKYGRGRNRRLYEAKVGPDSIFSHHNPWNSI